MFNKTSINNRVTTFNEISFNSVGGTLVKSCEESKFARFHMESKLAESFFHLEDPCWKQENYPYKRVSVQILQTMICGGNYFLVEFIENLQTEEF